MKKLKVFKHLKTLSRRLSSSRRQEEQIYKKEQIKHPVTRQASVSSDDTRQSTSADDNEIRHNDEVEERGEREKVPVPSSSSAPVPVPSSSSSPVPVPSSSSSPSRMGPSSRVLIKLTSVVAEVTESPSEAGAEVSLFAKNRTGVIRSFASYAIAKVSPSPERLLAVKRSISKDFEDEKPFHNNFSGRAVSPSGVLELTTEALSSVAREINSDDNGGAVGETVIDEETSGKKRSGVSQRTPYAAFVATQGMHADCEIPAFELNDLHLNASRPDDPTSLWETATLADSLSSDDSSLSSDSDPFYMLSAEGAEVLFSQEILDIAPEVLEGCTNVMDKDCGLSPVVTRTPSAMSTASSILVHDDKIDITSIDRQRSNDTNHSSEKLDCLGYDSFEDGSSIVSYEDEDEYSDESVPTCFICLDSEARGWEECK